METYNTCPCCGKHICLKDMNTPYVGKSAITGAKSRPIAGVYEHSDCGAVLGSCYKGDSYSIYFPKWAPADTPLENWRYFDLTVLGNNGVERIHGWFDIETRYITQIG